MLSAECDQCHDTGLHDYKNPDTGATELGVCLGCDAGVDRLRAVMVLDAAEERGYSLDWHGQSWVDVYAPDMRKVGSFDCLSKMAARIAAAEALTALGVEP
jgi:hypothetical protein